jgi:DMSO/TMAO reductase YedYZ heme-binding membrane subunit
MNPHRKIRSSPTLSAGPSRPVQGGLTVAVLVLIPLLAVAGSDDLRAALDFTTGVLSLVSLTAAVAWGLIATDRLFLSSRQRLLGQGIHRAAATASLGFLLLHVTVKVALGHVALLGALIPFGLGVSGTAGLIGFGSLAWLLMVVAAATGALRSAFATPGRIAGRWRALHALSYPAWCAALIHGLYAGRPPATWVVVMYSLSLLAVAAALCLRQLPPPVKRRISELIAALIKPDALASEPDPVLRESPLPGTGRVTPPGRGTLSREDLGRDQLIRDERAYGSTGRDRLGQDAFDTPLPSSFDRRELYEAPPRGSERLDLDPVGEPARTGPGPGISAAYRAVSRAAGTAVPVPGPSHQQPSARWPAPSPAPPAQAQTQSFRPPHEPAEEHPYDPYAADVPTGPLPAVDETAPLPGPLYPPPAGEPWQAPAGDRP